MSRVTTNADGILWDPDVQGPIDNNDDYKTCASTENSLTNLVNGATLAYVTGLSTSPHDNHVMQIQICAWYAKFMAKSQYKTWAATVLPKTGLTVIDSLSLLDNTLLHEVMNPRLSMRDAKLAYS